MLPTNQFMCRHPWVLVDQADYLYSKAKTAGLDIKFESLTITQGQMVDEFEAAVRTIWNEPMKAIVLVQNQSFMIKHMMIIWSLNWISCLCQLNNNQSYNLKVATVDTVVPLPTKEQVLIYEENDADPDLTTLIKKSITTYFSPIKTEIKGDYYYMTQLYEYYLDNIAGITYADSTLNANGELAQIINYQIDNYYSYLTYVANPDDVE
jgi:hypothetical protein